MSRSRGWALVALLAGCTPEPTTPPVQAHAQIEWAEWSQDSFAQAAAQDRLILINVVATWCHWCHVMDEVTFEDPEVAALLAEHFVVIRVDSDARPDVSERYSDWGWPATAFLSPQAQPVLNLRGFQKPREFASLLRELIAEHERGQLREFQEREFSPPADADLDRILGKATAQLDRYFDEEGLGWGDHQKYPWPDPIDYALLRARVRGEAVWRERALATLEAERALIDPVWGGMYQYSLEARWDRPHFEKIAAIQAGAIENYAHAALVTGDDRWLEPARQITAYLLGRMQDPKGGFYTSQDADLRRSDGTGVVGKDFYALDDAGRRELGIPRVDTAVYADLNGLTIHALTELYRVDADPKLLDAAVRAADRILTEHRSEGVAGIAHAAKPSQGELRHLADQAAMGWALLGLHRVTSDPRWLSEAHAIATFMIEALAHEDGGLFAHTLDPAAVGVFAERRKPLPENALAAQFFIELHLLLDGDGTTPTPWLEHARRCLLAVGGDAQMAASGKLVARYAFAIELLLGTKFDLTLVAAPDDPVGEALWKAALSVWEPRASFERSAPGQRYPDLGQAAVYMCSDRACSRPLRDPATAARALDAFALD